MVLMVTYRNRRKVKYESVEELKRGFIDLLKSRLREDSTYEKYRFFVTESRGTSLYCYVVDKGNNRGATFRISDHRSTVFAEDVDYGGIYYYNHKDLEDVVNTVYEILVQENSLVDMVDLELREYKVLEYLLYLNLSGYKLRVDVEKRQGSTYLSSLDLDTDYAGLTLHSTNFFKYTGIDKIDKGDEVRRKQDLDLACRNQFYDLVDLGIIRSLISKGLLTVYQETAGLEALGGLTVDKVRLNLNAKGLYYVSYIGMGVDVLRGITLSSWFTRYSLDLLLNSNSWKMRAKVGEVKWY